MRDVLIVSIVVIGALFALRRPWIGVMLWTWLSIMNPHRYAYGFANDAPLAFAAALCTLIGFLLTKDHRDWPFKGVPALLLALFMVWITLSWLFGLDPSDDRAQWDKVMKIDFMILVSLALLHTKRHIFALVWVCAGSLALLGAKGGLFTLATAGGHRVWGPPGSFIEDNNHFALALVMTIPLLRFLQLQLTSSLGRHAMTLLMMLVAAAALGSYSRGALLAISAMSLLMWWRGRSKFLGGVVILSIGLTLAAFMPEGWSQRMATIETYQEDSSALGRISAWWVAWR
jgi:putative inorganic carbon (HCO3(-)) transporter